MRAYAGSHLTNLSFSSPCLALIASSPAGFSRTQARFTKPTKKNQGILVDLQTLQQILTPFRKTQSQACRWTLPSRARISAECKAIEGLSGNQRHIGADSNTQRGCSKTMLAKLGQSFNSAGVAFTLKVIFKEPHLALAHISVPDITWIDWKALRQCGFEGVVFDKDNTLTAPYAENLWPTLSNSIEDCKTVFNGRIALLSNSAGLYQYDPDGVEAKFVENMLGIPVIRHSTKKPSGSADDLERYFGCDSSLLVMVGDRHFTDIVYGNKNGLLTVVTRPLTNLGEPMVVKQVRKLERYFVHQYYEKGLLPVEHRLLSHDCCLVKDPADC